MFLNIVFFVLIGPTIERMMGRGRFAVVLAAGAAVTSGLTLARPLAPVQHTINVAEPPPATYLQ